MIHYCYHTLCSAAVTNENRAYITPGCNKSQNTLPLSDNVEYGPMVLCCRQGAERPDYCQHTICWDVLPGYIDVSKMLLNIGKLA